MSKKAKNKGAKKKTNPQRKGSSSHNTLSAKEVVSFVGGTDVGKVRKNNEDNFIAEKIWGEKCILAAAIDGLGGYEGGELAAKIAKEKIVEYLKDSLNGERIELLKQAVTIANNAIYEASCVDDKYTQMGCVLTTAIIDVDNHLVNMVHVGDSRLYSFRHGVLKKLSHDHSFVGHREESGDLTEEQAMNHPNRNIVDRVIGHQHHLSFDQDFIEAATFTLESNTTFLFCSDGLTDMITSSAISEVLGRDCSLSEKKDALIQSALEAGGADNVTVVLVEYLAIEKPTLVQKHEIKRRKGRHTEKKVENRDEKNDKTDNKSKWHVLQIIICLIGGLIAGFLCGLYFSRYQCNNKQSVSPSEYENIDTVAFIFDTLIK